MKLLTRRADFGYGNARLRARRADLLGRAGYEALIGKDVDAILGALSETPYGPEVEAALTRHHGAHRLREAVRHHLARVLEEMRSFYKDRAGDLLDVLLSRWDLHNTVTLLRGEAVAPHTEDALLHVYPMGALGDALAREVARQNEFAAAVQLLVRWKLPDPETARGLGEAWPDYERTEDFPALEHAVTANWTARTDGILTTTGNDGAPLRRFFGRETDEKNLLVALRLREALRRGETDGLPVLEGYGVYLPGGSTKIARFDDAIRLPDAGNAATALAAGHEEWRRPLERWADSGDLAGLQYELEARRVRDAAGLFATGDPLGVDIPIAYAVAKETEARNLRLIGEGAARGLDPARVRARLVLFDEGGVP
ncbi:V-type ATPase subunit [Rubrobacter tropicus]|uniref:V-type ATPase subunit n=1 Tax=Rubrobacter tropicus TaxID=2653851 RepID=UPI0014077044|nr:V-type ATPase subunit [Rubrobacter tropicus]